jgi:hypothetical protein
MTLNNIEAIFKDIAERHKQVNSFYNQQAFDITSVDEVIYPSIVINTSEVSLPKGQAGYNTKSYSIELQFIDLVHKDENNKQEVLSDGASILNDMISELSTHPVYIEEGIDLINDITLNPLRNAYGDEVSGWNTLLTLQLPNRVSWCGSPLAALEGFDTPSFKVTITDALNPASPIELTDGSYTCIEADPKSGIQYYRPMTTGQTVSYRVGDDYWRELNIPYPAPPANPEIIQELTDFYTLKYDNAFGNKLRFTDINGNQTLVGDPLVVPDWTTDRYIIDNYTGLGWNYTLATSTSSKTNWNDAIDNCLALSAHGFNDWYLPNFNELMSVVNSQGNLYNLNIVWMGGARIQLSSSTRESATTNYYYVSSALDLSISAKTTTNYYHAIRQHF